MEGFVWQFHPKECQLPASMIEDTGITFRPMNQGEVFVNKHGSAYELLTSVIFQNMKKATKFHVRLFIIRI